MFKVKIIITLLTFLIHYATYGQNCCCENQNVELLGDYIYLLNNSNNGNHNFYYSITANTLPSANGTYKANTKWLLSIWVKLAELDKVYQINWNATVSFNRTSDQEINIPFTTGHYGQYYINRKGILRIYQKQFISQTKPIITNFRIRYKGTIPTQKEYKPENETTDFMYKEKYE
ncbi:exported protein of unknown function [Tenacibaculum sp. 190130A14a]|uniref:Uncharacterized protein n=1 Tax=Tenacibaculum polynesiense TaxID=3137857 RepID=A0ABM9P7A7_9FLAO